MQVTGLILNLQAVTLKNDDKEISELIQWYVLLNIIYTSWYFWYKINMNIIRHVTMPHIKCSKTMYNRKQMRTMYNDTYVWRDYAESRQSAW